MFAFSSHLFQLYFSFCYELYFRTVLDLQLYTPTLFLLLLISYITMRYKSQLINQNWWLVTKYIVCSDFLSFYLLPLSCRSHLKHYVTFRCHVSLGSSWLWEFLMFFFVFDDLDSLRHSIYVSSTTSSHIKENCAVEKADAHHLKPDDRGQPQ